MTRTLDSAVLLTREGVGHGSYGTNTCVNSAVDAALIHGTHPADGAVCKTEKPPPPAPLSSETVDSQSASPAHARNSP